MKCFKYIFLFNFLSLYFCEDNECMLTESAPVNVIQSYIIS